MDRELERISMLDFLQWNDKNGSFLDKDQIGLGNNPFDYKETFVMFAIEMFRDSLFPEVENYDISYEEVLDKLKKSFKLFSLQIAIKEIVEKKEQAYKKIIEVF